jgi:hypothetical protein
MTLEQYLEVVKCKPPRKRRITAVDSRFHENLLHALAHAGGGGQYRRGTDRQAVLSAPQEIISLP